MPSRFDIGRAALTSGAVMVPVGAVLCFTIVGAIVGIPVLLLGVVFIVLGLFIWFQALIALIFAPGGHCSGGPPPASLPCGDCALPADEPRE